MDQKEESCQGLCQEDCRCGSVDGEDDVVETEKMTPDEKREYLVALFRNRSCGCGE
jgi:hypothetical protein